MMIAENKRKITVIIVTLVTVILLLRVSEISVSAAEMESPLWIDHLDISNEVRVFYDKLIEGSDNDGVDDFLIEDSYFSGKNYIDVITITGDAGSKAEMDQQMEAIVDKYAIEIHAAYDAFHYDHPEVFWLDTSSRVGYSTSWNTRTWEYTLRIYFAAQKNEHDVRAENYRSEVVIKADITKRDQRVAEILAGAQKKISMKKLNILMIF